MFFCVNFCLLDCLVGEVGFCKVLVCQIVQEGFNEFWMYVVVIDVVGVFLDIDIEQGFVVCSQWCIGGIYIDDVD